MTSIRLHGVLAKGFGNVFSMKIGRASQAIEAIDANRPGFIKKINSLSRKGFYYSIVVDGKKIKNLSEYEKSKTPQEIDIVPIICGSGIVAGVVALAKIIAANQVLATFALFIISTAVQMLLAPKQEKQDVKATEASTRGLERSFEFSNKQNLASQGVPVPIGYGRLRVGSQIIQACIKTFPQNIEAAEAMIANPFYTQEGIAQSDNNEI